MRPAILPSVGSGHCAHTVSLHHLPAYTIALARRWVFGLRKTGLNTLALYLHQGSEGYWNTRIRQGIMEMEVGGTLESFMISSGNIVRPHFKTNGRMTSV